MSDQKYPKPLPTPSPETQRFLDGTKKHELWIPYCRSCQKSYWYPRGFCPPRSHRNFEWQGSGGQGRVCGRCDIPPLAQQQADA